MLTENCKSTPNTVEPAYKDTLRTSDLIKVIEVFVGNLALRILCFKSFPPGIELYLEERLNYSD
jgi:hypothetical protein